MQVQASSYCSEHKSETMILENQHTLDIQTSDPVSCVYVKHKLDNHLFPNPFPQHPRRTGRIHRAPALVLESPLTATMHCSAQHQLPLPGKGCILGTEPGELQVDGYQITDTAAWVGESPEIPPLDENLWAISGSCFSAG